MAQVMSVPVADQTVGSRHRTTVGSTCGTERVGTVTTEQGRAPIRHWRYGARPRYVCFAHVGRFDSCYLRYWQMLRFPALSIAIATAAGLPLSDKEGQGGIIATWEAMIEKSHAARLLPRTVRLPRRLL